MRFAPLVVDVAADAPTARVDDALYSNASAPFADLAKAERGYAKMLAERVVAAWTGAPLMVGHRYALTTTDALHDAAASPDGARAAAAADPALDGGSLVVDDGAAIPWSAVPVDARAGVLRDLGNLMDLAQGILRVDGGVPAAAKQKRGELGD